MITPYPMYFLLASNHANLQAINTIAQDMLNAVERVAVLNLETSRAAAEYAASGLRMLQGDDWQSTIATQSGALRTPTEATVTYIRSVQDISSAVQGEVAKVISGRTEEAAYDVAATIGKTHLPKARKAS